MGAIRYAFKDGRFVLADGCNITEADGVEELDCSVRLYKLLQQNGYDTIGQVTAEPGMTFFNMNCMSLVVLRELLERLDFLGFRLADWNGRQTVDEYFTVFQDAEEYTPLQLRIQDGRKSLQKVSTRPLRRCFATQFDTRKSSSVFSPLPASIEHRCALF